MRIWDIAPKFLCRKHLLGEHRELHAIWNILTIYRGQGGYSKHPETKRWRGKLAALYKRHQALVIEMERRGYHHHSPLNKKFATGKQNQDILINPIEEQKKILRRKSCQCFNHEPLSK